MAKTRIAISIGDPNGIGLEIALKAHSAIASLCDPTYCVDAHLLKDAARLLGYRLPKDIKLFELDSSCKIEPGRVSGASGEYSYRSFEAALDLAKKGVCDAIVTLPIHKKAWELAGVRYRGHTQMLKEHFGQEAIMMLGCEAMYVALFSEHIPLREVASRIQKELLERFLVDLYRCASFDEAALLGLNPHAGDDGVLGDEERTILEARDSANAILGKEVYTKPLVPDIAFTPAMRRRYRYYVALYHDQGLIPLKALYFDESINITLNLPIIRTSVDHGTAFDIAYKDRASTLSYRNAVGAAIKLARNARL